MKTSTDRILTTHTGSLPRPPAVVELMLAEWKSPGPKKAALAEAVAGAVTEAVGKQVAAGLDIINDGEQGRPDYTVHVKDRLTGFEGPSATPLGTGESEFPELAQILLQFASPFQYRPACSGPVGWRDFPAAEADIAQAKRATAGVEAEEIFFTSPSPGQIARYLRNRYYKTEEEYLFTLADVMTREYHAIVDAGFVLQLDCPDLAISHHMVYPHLSLSEYPQDHHRQRRGAEPRGEGPAGRPHAHAHLLGLDARPASHRRAAQGHRRHRAQGQAAGAVIPSRQPPPRPRVESLEGREARRQDHHSGRDRFRPRISSNIPNWWRTASCNMPSVVGRENVIAGVDCGFGTFAGRLQVDSKIVWMKLASLTEGAQLASEQLW